MFFNVLTLLFRDEKMETSQGKAAVIRGQSDEEDELEKGTVHQNLAGQAVQPGVPTERCNFVLTCRCPSKIVCLCIVTQANKYFLVAGGPDVYWVLGP